MSPFAWQSNKAVLFYLKNGKSIQILANWAVIKGEAYLGCFFFLRKIVCCCLVTKPCPTLWTQGLQHARLPCPSLSPRVCSNSCPLSPWFYPGLFFPIIRHVYSASERRNSVVMWNLSSLFSRDVILWLPRDKSILSLTLVGVAMSL